MGRDDALARRFGERDYSTTMTPHGNSAANVDSLLVLDGRSFAELDPHDDVLGGCTLRYWSGTSASMVK